MNIERLISLLFIAFGFFAFFPNEFIAGIKPQRLISIILFIIFLKRFKANKFRLILFFGLVITVIYAWILNPDITYTYILTKIFSLSLFLVVNSLIFQNKNYNWFLRGFALGGIINLFFFIGVFLYSKNIFMDLNYTNKHGFRFSGFFENPNILAGIYLTSSLSAYFLYISKKCLNNIIFLGTNIIGLLLTQSRGALVALICILAYYNLKNIFLIKSAFVTKNTFWTLCFLIIGFSAFKLISLDDSEIQFSRISGDTDVNLIETISDVKEERFWLYKNALKVVEKYPQGIGFSAHENVIGNMTGTYLIPHNFILTQILNYGLLLFPIWIIFYSIPVFSITIKKTYSSEKSVNFIIVAYFLYNLTHSLSDWIYLYFLLGISYTLNERYNYSR